MVIKRPNTIVAVVPMRGGSERVPGKNLRPLKGVPLYHYVVRTLLEVPEIDEVVIDSDSPEILSSAAEVFPQVTLVRRPDELGRGHVSMNDVLINTFRSVAADWVVQVHATSPLLKPATLSAAIKRLAHSPEHDSAFGVTRLQARFWDHLGKPMNHDPAVLLRTQDLAPIFLENSSFYLFHVDNLKRFGNRVGQRPLMIEVDPIEAIDIDIESDFQLIDAVMQERTTNA